MVQTLSYGVAPLLASIVLKSGYVFAFAIFMNRVSAKLIYDITDFRTILILLADHITNSIELNQQILEFLQGPADFALASAILGYLGPYIRTHDTIYFLLGHIINLLEFSNSPLLGEMNYFHEEMGKIGNRLMKKYRFIEKHILNIPIENTALPTIYYEE